LSTSTMLNMTLCVDKCTSDCKSYTTPLSQCYSSKQLFPNDPSWSAGKDVFDAVICQTLTRTIYGRSYDGTCSKSDREDDDDDDDVDRFTIPLNECVGPFGQPRPWGSFSIITDGVVE
jgi:hypothetical protein